jgi:hypothetical protein
MTRIRETTVIYLGIAASGVLVAIEFFLGVVR